MAEGGKGDTSEEIEDRLYTDDRPAREEEEGELAVEAEADEVPP